MIYIIRHGKTQWNEMHKLQGRTDIPLNESGREMAKEAAKLYKDVHFDLCYTSPLKRARETAALLLEGRNIPIIPDDRLMEMSFGESEGIENSFDTPELPINVLFHKPEEYVAGPGGESLDELYERTGSFLKEVAYPLHEEGKSVLIVGHGAMNCSIVSQVKNIPRSEYWNCGIENCKLKQLV